MIRSGGQYDTSASLETRISLHDRFSRNPQGWFPWLRELLHPHLAGRVLDVGCGTGVFWSDGAVHSRCSEITLADSSSAMIDVVRTRLSHDPRFRFEVCDARTLPFADASFEVLTAFHMLYDVPDMDAALSEFARATSPGGVVAISTNGVGHLRELDALLNRFVPGASWGDVPTRFTLENAESVLAGVFPQVLIHRYEDELWITDAEAVVEWAASSPGASDLTALRSEVSERIGRDGGLRVTKSSGCVLLTSNA